MTKFSQVFLFSGFVAVSTCLLPSNFGSLVYKGVFDGTKKKLLVVKFFKVELSLKIISEIRNSAMYIDYLQRELEKKMKKMTFYKEENKRSSIYEERELKTERLETMKLCLSHISYPR